MQKKRTRMHPERDIESSIRLYLRLSLPDDAVSFHIPNEASYKRRDIQSCGVLAGVPDHCIIWRGSVYFIECKAKRGRISDDQRATVHRLVRAGAYAAVARSIDDVQIVLQAWGFPLKAVVWPKTAKNTTESTTFCTEKEITFANN